MEGIIRLPHNRRMRHAARKVSVGLIGGSVLAVGVALTFLPGPAIVLIPLGLAVLAKEFLWARRLLRPLKELVARWRSKI